MCGCLLFDLYDIIFFYFIDSQFFYSFCMSKNITLKLLLHLEKREVYIKFHTYVCKSIYLCNVNQK